MEKIEILKSEVRSRKSEIEAQLKDRPFVLFLSRLHYKKGLDLLIRSWAKIQKSEIGIQKSGEWVLAIAGTGSPAYVNECRQLAEQLGIAKQCLWLGHVDEWQKSWLYSNAAFYVLPTASENFGNTVAEALAHGTPVITTIHTPWSVLRQQQCGWVVDNTETELCQAISEAFQLEALSRARMGEAGLKLVRETYSLASVLNKVESVYNWVAGDVTKPEWVV
jgi:glycosyltransferase involved in cell wall biosynthesis